MEMLSGVITKIAVTVKGEQRIETFSHHAGIFKGRNADTDLCMVLEGICKDNGIDFYECVLLDSFQRFCRNNGESYPVMIVGQTRDGNKAVSITVYNTEKVRNLSYQDWQQMGGRDAVLGLTQKG